MQHLRLTLQYDGGSFAGWQLQPGQRTVQGVLEDALATILGGRRVSVAVAGRTDSGVHARAQVASFRAPEERPMRAWLTGLNGVLPEDLAVSCADEVPEDFDPRRWAQGKRYVYRIWNGEARAPLLARWSWQLGRRLKLEPMREAAALLVGERDFACFQAAGCAAETTIRVIESVDVAGSPGDEISIEVKGSAFLRHMVRNIAGTLVEVGLGRRAPEEMRALLESRDRRLAGRTAPARGLTLEEVYYGPEPPRRRLMVPASKEQQSKETG